VIAGLTLAGPDCALNERVNVALDVHGIWADPIPHAAKMAFLDLIIQVLVTGRIGTTVLKALIQRNAPRSRIGTNATGEFSKVSRSGFLREAAVLFQANPMVYEQTR
jgi:hypothetical protein